MGEIGPKFSERFTVEHEVVSPLEVKPPLSAPLALHPDIGLTRPPVPEGWSPKSYADLSGPAKSQYDAANVAAKLRSVWNAAGSLLSFRGGSSAEILKNQGQVIDDKVREKSGEYGPGPSSTVKKLTEATGPRAGRLGPTDLGFLATSIMAGKNDAHLVDGYSMSAGGMGFTNVSERKPSELLSQELAKPENAHKKLLMPFTFPANGGSEEHVVLITADPAQRQIRYFDPKGAFSDDPSRIGGFKDNPNFNMRNDLQALASNLGPGWNVLENTRPFQHDPTNCGAYVAKALEDEANSVTPGTVWQSGPAWINQEKQRMAIDMWNHYSRPESSDASKGEVRAIDDEFPDS